MGEHERMKVWLDNGTTVYFVKLLGDSAHFTFTPKNWSSYSDDARISSIHAVIGEPLTFDYGLFGSQDFKSDTNVKDIKYDVPCDA